MTVNVALGITSGGLELGEYPRVYYLGETS